MQRIGKYKSAGDQLLRKDISDANREMLTAILDDTYFNWISAIAAAKGAPSPSSPPLGLAGIAHPFALSNCGFSLCSVRHSHLPLHTKAARGSEYKCRWGWD